MYKEIKGIWNSLEAKEKKYLKIGLKIILIIGFFSIIILPWLLTRESISIVDYKLTGAIGDTINGIAGPFIALAAAILTFLAFYIQYKANLEQRIQFNKTFRKQEEEAKEQRQQFITNFEKQIEERKEQEKIWKIERFENQFYEMVKLHKENVSEISINLTTSYHIGKEQHINIVKINGREVFKYLLEEINILYFIAKKNYIAKTNSDALINIAYGLFFHGNRFDKKITPNKPDQKEYSKFINAIIDINNEHKSTDLIQLKQIVEKHVGFKNAVNLNFLLGQGHSSYLAHYYRHLYQTVKFVADQKEDFISYNEKRKYLRILRAQLSNQEQAMLFYNWKSNFGKSWENDTNHYFTNYRMIHNIYNGLIIDDFKLIKIFNLMQHPPTYRTENGRAKDVLFEFEDW